MTNKADPWDFLKQHTHARIALGRAGHSIPTQELLEFRLAHSLARDSIKEELDLEKLQLDLQRHHHSVLKVQSRCSNKNEFLLNPNLGRQLNDDSVEQLKGSSSPENHADCVIVIADGLSTPGIQTHGPIFAKEFTTQLAKFGISLAPIIIAKYARVALGDEIGSIMKSRSVLMLIGERPGLGSAESISVYFTYDPQRSRTDADRNCISNIHPAGLSPIVAGQMAAFLAQQSLVRQLSGVDLKVEYPDFSRLLG